MSAARALINECAELGIRLALDGSRVKLSAASPPPAHIVERLREQKAMVVLELMVRSPWWRDPQAIRARFDEIAGQIEFENGVDRDDAERQAKRCLYRELLANGLSDHAARNALTALKEGANHG